MDFSTFGLSDRLLRGIKAGGLRVPTPFQSLLLQALVDGRNVVALSPPVPEVIPALTLPVLHRSALLAPEGREDRSPRVLIVTTNRDRARNLQRGALSYGRFLSLRTVALYGGVTLESQLPLIQQGSEILVATPERLMEHLDRGTVPFGGIGFVVIDEADGLFEAGFGDLVIQILARLTTPCQTFILAAQMTDPLRAFVAERFPDSVEIKREAPPHVQHPHRMQKKHHDVKGKGRTVGRHGEKSTRGAAKRSGQPKHSGSGLGGFRGSSGRPVSTVAGHAKRASHSSHPGHPGRPTSGGHPLKGKAKVRKHSSTTMVAPRKKRPPKKMDSFSSDRGGAGWSSY